MAVKLTTKFLDWYSFRTMNWKDLLKFVKKYSKELNETKPSYFVIDDKRVNKESVKRRFFDYIVEELNKFDPDSKWFHHTEYYHDQKVTTLFPGDGRFHKEIYIRNDPKNIKYLEISDYFGKFRKKIKLLESSPKIVAKSILKTINDWMNKK